MYLPQKIISENIKTGVSINFPTKRHCRPTILCKKACYAKSGPMLLPVSRKKQQYVSDYFKGNNLRQVIGECWNFQTVRLNGCGDFLAGHLTNILTLARECTHTMFYGMTRKPEIANVLNNQLPNLKLLLSVDATTPKKVSENYPGKICFGPRRAIDTVPNDKRIITVFPYHCHGKVITGIPKHKKDCPAVWHKVSGCMKCKRCWNW